MSSTFTLLGDGWLHNPHGIISLCQSDVTSDITYICSWW